MPRSRAPLFPHLVLALVLVPFAGCGGAHAQVDVSASASVPEAPPVPMRAPESLLPPAAPIVFRVDFAALRESERYSVVRGWLGDSEGASELADVVDRTEEIWGALIPGPNGRMLPLVVARGRYSPEDERRIFASAEPAQVVDTRARFTIHHHSGAAASHAGAHTALVGDHTIVIGDRAAVEGALELQESGDGPGPSDPVVTAAMERIGFRQLGAGIAMRITEAVYANLELPPMLYSSLESASAGLTLDDALHGVAAVRTSNAFVAGTLVTLARSQLAEASREPRVEALGLAPLLSGITLASEGPEAWVRLELSGAELEGFASSLSAAFGAGPDAGAP